MSPPDFSAEMAIIGSLLAGANNLDRIRNRVRAADFPDPLLSEVFAWCCDQSTKGEPIDPILMKHAFAEHKGVLELGGPAKFIATLLDNAADEDALPTYARLISETAERRRIQSELQAALAEAASRPPSDVLNRLSSTLALASARSATHRSYKGWTPVNLADMARSPAKGLAWVLKGLLGQDTFATVYGPSGAGKSFLVLDLCLHVAAGREWRGHKAKPVGVVYLAAEGGSGLMNRIAAARTRLDLEGCKNFALLDACPDLLRDKGDAGRLISAVKLAAKEMDAPISLLVIDTLARVMAGGNENSSDDMGAVIARLGQIQRTLGVTVLVVHHTGKDVDRGLRGHSSLRAAVDTAIEVERAGQNRGVGVVKKQKDGAEGGRYPFELVPVQISEDEDGDGVWSCAVEPLEAGHSPTAKPAGLTGGAQIALRELHNAIVDDGEPAPASDYIPGWVRGVKADKWRRACYRAGISGTDNPEAKRQAFHRARQALNARNVIGDQNGFIWIRADEGDRDDSDTP